MKYMRTILVMLVVTSAALAAGERIDERIDAAPDGKVEIANIAGSVVIIGWNRDEVEITGTLGKGTERLDIDTHGDTIEIEVIFPKGRNHNIGDTDLTIHVPRGSDLDVSTISAGIDVSEVEGSLELSSISGAIRVKGEPEEMEIDNISGLISIDAPIRRGEFTTVSGTIEATLDVSRRGRCEFDSLSGNIRLRVPANLDADFEITTFSGTIRSDFGARPRRTSRYTPGKELEFSTGRGGARISVNSFSGRVTIEED